MKLKDLLGKLLKNKSGEEISHTVITKPRLGAERKLDKAMNMAPLINMELSDEVFFWRRLFADSVYTTGENILEAYKKDDQIRINSVTKRRSVILRSLYTKEQGHFLYKNAHLMKYSSRRSSSDEKLPVLPRGKEVSLTTSEIAWATSYVMHCFMAPGKAIWAAKKYHSGKGGRSVLGGLSPKMRHRAEKDWEMGIGDLSGDYED